MRTLALGAVTSQQHSPMLPWQWAAEGCWIIRRLGPKQSRCLAAQLAVPATGAPPAPRTSLHV